MKKLEREIGKLWEQYGRLQAVREEVEVAINQGRRKYEQITNQMRSIHNKITTLKE